MISLMIILALVTVPLALIARLSFTVLARLLGVTSQSEVATRAEFARIREQLFATAGEDAVKEQLNDSTRRATAVASDEHATAALPVAAEWRQCPQCTASVSSAASICLQCGAQLGPPS